MKKIIKCFKETIKKIKDRKKEAKKIAEGGHSEKTPEAPKENK